jgi:hypothetical protein
VVTLRFESRLAASAAVVWVGVSTMRGVNAELMPLLRMTAPVDRVEFASWVLLGGFLPIDRHYLRLERVLPGAGFDERSTSWSQRVWIHRRRVSSSGAGACVADELEFEPGVKLLTPVLRAIVAAIFRHRHRRLRTLFAV